MEGVQIFKWMWNGLHLQEPSVFITDMILAIFCFFVFLKLNSKTKFEHKWRMFYFTLGLCTLLGGFGHLLFYYFGIPGKSVAWIFSIISNYYASTAILSEVKNIENKTRIRTLCWSKSIFLGVLAIVSQKFVFIAVDAAITFLYFAAYLSFKINKPWNKWMIYGVYIMIPSTLFLIFKIDPHLHFNRVDVGHFFMIAAISSFWKGIIEYKKEYLLN
jgi:hypothetical protein